MLSNIPVTWRMIVSALLPTLALLYFSSSLVLQEWRIAGNMRDAEQATEFSRDISQLVHELQRERGRSAGFVGSGGDASYQGFMQDQRQATDTAMSRYAAARLQAGEALEDPDLAQSLSQVDDFLAALPEHRRQIDSLNLNMGQTVGPYTQTISAMLNSVADLSHLGASSDVSAQLIGLLNLMSAKENAGMIRKVVSEEIMPPWFAAAPPKGHSSPWANDRSLPPEDKADFAAAVNCSMCGEPLGDCKPHRDHDHMTGKYRGGALPEGSRKKLFNRLQRYETPKAEAAINSYLDLADEIGADPAQLAIRFCDTRPFMGSTIIGATSMDQLKTCIDAFAMAWSEEIEDRVNALHLAQPSPCP